MRNRGSWQGVHSSHRLPRPTEARLRSTYFLARPRRAAGTPWPLENPNVRLAESPGTRGR